MQYFCREIWTVLWRIFWSAKLRMTSKAWIICSEMENRVLGHFNMEMFWSFQHGIPTNFNMQFQERIISNGGSSIYYASILGKNNIALIIVITGDPFQCFPSISGYHTAVIFGGVRFRGDLNRIPMMPRDASLSDGCTPDRCSYSTLHA